MFYHCDRQSYWQFLFCPNLQNCSHFIDWTNIMWLIVTTLKFWKLKCLRNVIIVVLAMFKTHWTGQKLYSPVLSNGDKILKCNLWYIYIILLLTLKPPLYFYLLQTDWPQSYFRILKYSLQNFVCSLAVLSLHSD